MWEDNGYNLEDIVREAKKLFFRVGITTNGTFPIDADAQIIWVSIDGLKENHDLLRGVSFDRIISNITESFHPNIFAHITINSINWKDIPALVEFLSAKVRGITIQFYYPYREVGKDLFLPFHERRIILNDLIRLKRRGLAIVDSYACLEALKNNRWTCHPWMIASVDPDGRLTHGCYVKNRGAISCESCGFSAHTEISLAYSGGLESILVGNRVFH